jgi:3'-5' exoribonuclease
MPDQNRRIIEFSPGTHFNGLIMAVVEMKMRTANNGNQYLTLRLRDCTTQSVNAKWFGPPSDIMETLAGTRLVRIGGVIDNSSAFSGDLKLRFCEPFAEPEDLSPYLTPLPADHSAHRNRFLEVIRTIKQPQLKALLKEIFSPEKELWAKFQTAPAAKSMHHSHRGGLLEHSGEVAILCDRVCATLPHLDRDLLVTAALLHDIGKLEEMESDLAAGEYTAAGHLVGHIVLGTCTIACAAESIPDFPTSLKHELMHLILSHHGRSEFGAAKTPMCAEAIILNSCDTMSAKVAQIRSAAEGDGEPFPRLYGWHERETNGTAYVGAMRRMFECD